ncbi:MAG: hypothetical protein FMNOHCHN_03661 [Ignavibacteriaceae bacterium]|nr:hypothetical protein [Ignavibacteriaceae bacterium]
MFTLFLALAPAESRAVNFDGELGKKETNKHIETKAVIHKFRERTLEIPVKRLDERSQFFAHARHVPHTLQAFLQAPFGILQFSILFLDLFHAQRARFYRVEQILHVQIVLGEFGFDFAFELCVQWVRCRRIDQELAQILLNEFGENRQHNCQNVAFIDPIALTLAAPAVTRAVVTETRFLFLYPFRQRVACHHTAAMWTAHDSRKQVRKMFRPHIDVATPRGDFLIALKNFVRQNSQILPIRIHGV